MLELDEATARRRTQIRETILEMLLPLFAANLANRFVKRCRIRALDSQVNLSLVAVRLERGIIRKRDRPSPFLFRA